MVFVIWLAMGKFGNIPLGRDDEEPEFRTVSWIAMMFSAGMGIGLMFYGVSEPVTHFVDSAARHRRGRQPRERPDGHGHHAVPLDAAPLGDLRRGRPGHRVRRLPQGPAPADQLGVRAAPRPPRPRARRQGHRHARDLRDPLRLRRLAGTRRPADRSGLEIVGGLGSTGNARARRDHRRPHRRLRAAPRLRRRQGHPVAVQHQHGARRRPGPLRLRRRSDRLHPQPGPDLDRQLHRTTCR